MEKSLLDHLIESNGENGSLSEASALCFHVPLALIFSM